MILPGREDLAPFKDFKSADFAAWLKVGLEAYLIEDEGVWGFEHVAVFLQGEEHLALALGHIYRELPARKRAEFRKAVAYVMATLEADPVNAPVFEHLLAIAAVLPAPEVLSVLPVRIGNGFFGAMNVEGGRGLFEKTMDAVIDLAAPTKECRICLEMLIGSRNFNIAYSGLALMTLCRVAPHAFVDHMDLLRAPLAKMFDKFKTDEETKKRLAERIEVAVPRDVLAEGLPKLRWEDMWLRRHLSIDTDEQNVSVEGRRTGQAGVVESSPRITNFINQIKREWKAEEVERSRLTGSTYKAAELFSQEFRKGLSPKLGTNPRRSRHEHARHA